MNLILGHAKPPNGRFGRIANIIGHHDPDWWPGSPSGKLRSESNVGNFIVAIVSVVLFIAVAFAVFVK